MGKIPSNTTSMSGENNNNFFSFNLSADFLKTTNLLKNLIPNNIKMMTIYC